jgi:predicted Zn-dependent protease
LLGDHQKELDEARRGLGLNPGDRRALYYELRALIALERVEEVRERISEMVNSPASAGGSSSGYYLYLASRDARAHGLPQLAAELAQRAIEWLEALPPATFATLQYTYAQALYTAERWLDAGVVFDSLAAERPDNVDYLGFQGVIAARIGDAERAMQISEQLAAVEEPYEFAYPTMWRARIAALLGDEQQAMALLTQALGEGAFQGLGMRHDMDLESLHEYPPFQELMRPKG